MADNRDKKVNEQYDVSAGTAEGTPPAGDVVSQRGGEQSDQLSGETQKGAHNQEMKGQNPQGNKPDQNQQARQKGSGA